MSTNRIECDKRDALQTVAAAMEIDPSREPVELTGFAEACYNDNSLSELVAALLDRKADAADCQSWKIKPAQWRAGIRQALQARLYEAIEDTKR